MERCIDDELPFEIPENWCWARLESISSYAETKQKVNAANADSAIWGLDLEDIEKGGRLIVRKTVGERKAIGDKRCSTTEPFRDRPRQGADRELLR